MLKQISIDFMTIVVTGLLIYTSIYFFGSLSEDNAVASTLCHNIIIACLAAYAIVRYRTPDNN